MTKPLDSVYLEITNVCNFSCSFCHRTKRPQRFMTEEEFSLLTDRLCGRARYLYFHLMGEPTLHPLLSRFITEARKKGFRPILTTNGSLLRGRGEEILAALPHKVNISLHASAANEDFAEKTGYFTDCISFAKRAAARGITVGLRLWNLGSGDDNGEILTLLHAAFSGEWTATRVGESMRLAESVYLEWGERFTWPDEGGEAVTEEDDTFCYALRSHIGVLVDGTVVPCCLDADGALALGNLFDTPLDAILAAPRATAMREGFSRRTAVEPLCRTCGFVGRFSKKKNG